MPRRSFEELLVFIRRHRGRMWTDQELREGLLEDGEDEYLVNWALIGADILDRKTPHDQR